MMGPIAFKRIVSVSSEDVISSGKNLLFPACGKKWLCAATDKSRQAEIEFELCKKTKIAELEIGNFGSAFVEVLVGCSDAEGSCMEFITLLPQSALMSVPDCKMSRNVSRTARYTKERLCAVAMGQKWNRLKVVCRQPFNPTVQFGLSRFVVFSQAVTANEPSPPASNSPPIAISSAITPSSPSINALLGSPLPSTPNNSGAILSPCASNISAHSSPSPCTPSNSGAILSPCASNNSAHSSPLSEAQMTTKLHDNNSATPKRPIGRDAHSVTTPKLPQRAVRSNSPLTEFTGVELQSRLLHNALRGIPHNDRVEKETNPILLRIMAEREKYRAPHPAPRRQTPEKIKLLDKQLPTSDLKTDFALSYQKTNDSSALKSAMARMAAHDEDCEMGEEPEFVWGRGKSKSKRRKREPSTGCSEWLSKRKSVTTVASATCTLVQGVQTQLQPKVHSDVQLHIDDNVLLNKEELPVLSNIEGKEGLHGGVPPPIHTITEGIYVDYIPLVPILAPPPQVVEEIMPCPLCGIELPQYALITHASSCGEIASN